MHGAHLHKTSRRDAMARDPRRDLLGRDRDILLRDWDETLVRLETVSRPRRLDRDHIPAISFDCVRGTAQILLQKLIWIPITQKHL